MTIISIPTVSPKRGGHLFRVRPIFQFPIGSAIKKKTVSILPSLLKR